MDPVFVTFGFLPNGTIKLNINIIKYPESKWWEDPKKKLIIATWIGKTNRKAQADYKREISRTDGRILWDDSAKNVAKEEGYFAFIDGRQSRPIIKIYKILKIYTPQERLREWSPNGYTNEVYDTSTRRAFIASSKCIKEIDWRTYADNVGYSGSHLQSTQTLKNSKLFNF
jgi:hypothetical protein